MSIAVLDEQPMGGIELGARGDYDLISLTHLRWDFVYQRPQHLLSRAAAERRVYYIEEPTFGAAQEGLEVTRHEGNMRVVVPRLPHGLSEAEAEPRIAALLDGFIAAQGIERFVLWYYTPMALGFTNHLRPLATIYDCMDELSAFKFAPPQLHQREVELFQQANLVFTGGQSLFEAKRDRHPRVYRFPSSVDVAHFAQAKGISPEPADQRDLPHPRLGFFGVVDERMDLDLLRGIAELRPHWQIVMIGPVVKIDPADRPQLPNIHWLGGRGYDQLPAYIAGWEVAMLPFARNESTRFISRTKTPEYLAAGKPVVSTSIRDVVRPYSELGLVRIADTPSQFVAAAEAAMLEDATARQRRVDDFLSQMSWDSTWAEMHALIDQQVEGALAAIG